MNRRTETLTTAYFDAVYASDADPWRFASSSYERKKYAMTLAALPKPRYSRALEVGCSIGVLTLELSSRCEDLLAIDAAKAPLEEAVRRCSARPHVRFEPMFVPDQWPDGSFDLIVLSEIVYYLRAGDVDKLAARIASTLAQNGDVVLVHWLGETDYPLSGDEATERLISAMGAMVSVERADRHDVFRVDVLKRR